MKILSDDFTKLIVENRKTGEIFAIIDEKYVDTCNSDIVVRLTPNYKTNVIIDKG